MKPWKAELILFSVTFIWGATFLFTKFGLQDCSPSLFILMRFGIAFAISLLVFGKYLIRIDRKTLIQSMIMGFIFGGGFVLQTYGLVYTTISKSAFITGSTVVITPFVYFLFKRKKIRQWQKWGVVVAFIGMWLFTNPEFDKLNIGDVMTVFSTLFWAFYITCMDLFTKGETDFAKTAQLTALPFITASIPPLITYFLFDLALPAPSFTPNLFLALGFNGIIASFFLTFMHTSFQRYTTPVKASLIFSLEPVFASLLAMLFYNEMLHNREWTGASILMAGVLLSETGHLMFGRIRS